MTVTTIREMLHARPFRAFNVITADGTQLPVDHPDFVSVSPNRDVVVVYKPKGGFTILDPSQITALDVQPKPPKKAGSS